MYAYYSRLQGVPFHPGVTDQLTYSTFRPAEVLPPDVVLVAETEAIIPHANCVVVDATVQGPSTLHGSETEDVFGDLTLVLPENEICQRFTPVSIPAFNPQRSILPTRQLSGAMQPLHCSRDLSGQDASGDQPQAYLYTLTDIRYQQKLFGNASQLHDGHSIIAADASRSVAKVVSVMCQPSYSFTKVLVSNDTSRGTVSVSRIESAQNNTLPGLSAQDLSLAMESSLRSASALFGTTNGQINTSSQVQSTLFTLIALTQGSKDYSILLDAQNLLVGTAATYQGVVSQYVRQSLTTASNLKSTGSTIRSEFRLQLQPVALWVLIIGFALLTTLTSALIFINPGAVVSRDPNSIGSIATFLTRSNDLQWLLRRHGSSNQARLKLALSAYRLHSAIIPSETGNPNFKIIMDNNELRDSVPDIPPVTSLTSWRPGSSHIVFPVLSVVLPIGGIIALEFLQQQSNRHDGILSLADSDSSVGYTHFLPAFIVLLCVSIYNILEFNISLFSAYTPLKSGYASARRTLNLGLLGKLPPFALFTSITTRHLTAVLAILAAMLASVLTILVSGLYSILTADQTSSTSVTPLRVTSNQITYLDTFNPHWPNSVSDDSGAAALLSLLEHNRSQLYPNFVYDQFAFQSIQLKDVGTSSTLDSSLTTNGTIQALRASLSCTVLPKSSLFTVYFPADSPLSVAETDVAVVASTVELPASCHLAGTGGTGSSVTFNSVFSLREDQVTYGGQVLDLVFGKNSGIYGNYGEDNSQEVGDSPAVGCPSLGITFGSFMGDGTDLTEETVTSMVCWQGLEKLDVSVTFAVNSTGHVTGQILDAEVPKNASQSAVENPYAANDAGRKFFDWRIQQNFQNELEPFRTTSSLDHFFQALIYGRDAVDPATLLGSNNEAQLFERIQALYARYMALVINGVMREPCNVEEHCGIIAPVHSPQVRSLSRSITKRQPNSSSTSRPDVQTNKRSTARLIQNNPTKLAMQILLGLIAFFSVLTVSLTHHLWWSGSGLVPQNICTIAGVMALLAGSDLCYNPALLSCECCGRPRKTTDGVSSIVIGEGIVAKQKQIIPEGSEWASNAELERIFNAADGSGRRMKYSLGWWKERPEIPTRITKRFGIDVGARADGLDDQDWEIGKRGGVRGSGLGWSDFMMRNWSKASFGRGSRVRVVQPEDVTEEGLYMRGALSGPQSPEDDVDDGQQQRVERFSSLRGHGYAYTPVSPRAVGRDSGGLGHSRGLSRFDNQHDAMLLRPPAEADIALAGTTGRKVRWNEKHQVRYYPVRKSEDGDASSSLYSGDGYGASVEERHSEQEPGRQPKSDLQDFDFGFDGGEA